ncbi:hypothetical protein [Candidatus Halobonum tyrrellensis]|uniref:hypothetical protein n=1 Tax=Candidatus Halobonum tyrrellensis TaxID=1431545 RepID=UPI001267ADD1|nr:hypothetical protein [Candidatus Halobonum tyrrellensis]
MAVDPAWFFSTIAQSAAAAIAFIITFGGILYQIEYQDRRKRTDDLRERLIAVRDKHRTPIRSALWMLNTLDRKGMVEVDIDVDDEDILEKCVGSKSVKYPYSVASYIIIEKIERRIAKISAGESTQDHYLISREQIRKIYKLSENLYDIIRSDEFEDEIRSQTEISGGRIVSEQIFGNQGSGNSVFTDPHPNNRTIELKEWLQNHGLSDSHSGQDIYSLVLWLRELMSDLARAESQSKSTLLNYNPNANKLLIAAGVTIITSVLIPLIFLVWLPADSVLYADSGWGLTFLEAKVLLISSISFLNLFWIIWDETYRGFSP